MTAAATPAPIGSATPDGDPSARREIVVAMPDALFARFFTDADLARLRALGEVRFSPTPRDHRSPAAQELLSAADVLITGWGTDRLDAELLADAPRLRAVVHSAGSVRKVVAPDVYRHGLRVSSQTALNAAPVAEYTLAMILLAAKDVFRAARLYAEVRGPVDREAHFPTAGAYLRRVGFIGLSMISRQVIELLRPFGAEMLVYSRHLGDAEAEALGVRRATLKEIMSTAEVISLHSADVPANYRMIGAEELALVQDGATFINTARGRLVDQDALIDELRTGRFDAVLDVADPDVTVPDSPLWEMDNVLLTPHFAGSVGNELYRLGNGVVDDIESFVAGRPMAGEIPEEQYAARA